MELDGHLRIRGNLVVDQTLFSSSFRELLMANRTYYVRSDGSDTNTGLANTAEGAFLTIAKAISVASTLDLSTFTVTIQIGIAGSYAGGSVSAAFIGGTGSSVTLRGDPTAPSSYVINSGITLLNNTRLLMSGLDFTPTAGDALTIGNNSVGTINGACVFGATAVGSRQIVCSNNGLLNLGAPCTIDGNSTSWIVASLGGTVSSNQIHTFSGTPAFTITVQATTGGIVSITGVPSGSATGTRYSASLNGIINTNGGGANHFPGDVAGVTATGGQYA